MKSTKKKTKKQFEQRIIMNVSSRYSEEMSFYAGKKGKLIIEQTNYLFEVLVKF